MRPLRYVLGSSMGVFIPDQASPPADEPVGTGPIAPIKLDVKPTIVGLDEGGVVLSFPPFDPVSASAPAETRAYFVRSGEPVPYHLEEWLTSSIPYSVSTAPPSPFGEHHTLPIPDGLVAGDYLVQTILGYDDEA